MRLTVAELSPHSLAIDRVLHCVAPRGNASSVRTTTRSASSSPAERGVTGRGSSGASAAPAVHGWFRGAVRAIRQLTRVPRSVPAAGSLGTDRDARPNFGQAGPLPQGPAASACP